MSHPWILGFYKGGEGSSDGELLILHEEVGNVLPCHPIN